MGYVAVWLLLVLVSCCVCGAIAGSIASKRGASYGGYFALGFFFGVIGIIAAAFAGHGRVGGTTIINNYYAVAPDGSHTLMTAPPTRIAPARRPATPLRHVAPARTDLETRACGDESCSAVGERTSNLVCQVCRRDTVMAYAAPRSHADRLRVEKQEAQLRDLPPVSAVARGPAHLLTRRCAQPGCGESTVLTSNLVCRSCRRDTVPA